MTLWPFFSFFGGKWRTTKRYPAPEHDKIIEPFAGSAGYSVRYFDRDVLLVEKDPKIAAVWRYLTSATERDIQGLPLLAPGDSVDDFDLSGPEKWLIGFWLNKGAAAPSKSLSAWGRDPANATQWLPFEPFLNAKANHGAYRSGRSREAIWTA